MSEEIVQFTDEELAVKAFWETCVSKEHLDRWVQRYLGFKLPDAQTCTDDVDNPATNSSPLDLLWELYSAGIDGHDETKQRFLAYAARDSGKTLVCAVFEVMAIFHLRRDVAHMAAVESQALKCISYIDEYMRRPILRDFLSGNNKRTIEISWYNKPDGTRIPTRAWNAIVDPKVKEACIPETYTIQVIICTIRGANSAHVPIFIADEVDLADPAAFREAKMIPGQSRRGELSLALYTSSRKYAFGLMQKEIDGAAESGLNIRHWNLIDITKRCPPERHLPAEPRLPIFYNEDELKAIPQEEYDGLNPEAQEKYKQELGYAGCLKNCTLFAQCRGRLARKPKNRSKVMKPVMQTITSFRDLNGDVEVAKAQLMCWKPEASGLVYKYLNPERHFMTAQQMAEKLTGDEYPERFTKAELLELIATLQLPFMSGLDHGYRHQFAVTTAAIQGINHFVINSVAATGLELDERIELCKQYPVIVNSTGIWADPAYPADNKTFRRHGFRIRNFVKDVDLGIQNTRRLINPVNHPEAYIYFLKGDSGVEYAFKRMQVHHFKIGPDGKPTDQLDDDEADVPDSVRYLCQNTVKHRHWQDPSDKPKASARPSLEAVARAQNTKMMGEMVQQLQGADGNGSTGTGITYKRSNKFFFGG